MKGVLDIFKLDSHFPVGVFFDGEGSTTKPRLHGGLSCRKFASAREGWAVKKESRQCFLLSTRASAYVDPSEKTESARPKNRHQKRAHTGTPREEAGKSDEHGKVNAMRTVYTLPSRPSFRLEDKELLFLKNVKTNRENVATKKT